MSEQWYCPNCGPEISVTVERIHTGLLIPLMGLVLVALAVRWRVWL